MFNKIVLTFAEIACSTWVGNVTGTLMTKTGNKIFDKCLVGVGGMLVGNLLVDAAVKNVEEKLPKKEDKEETEDGRSEE